MIEKTYISKASLDTVKIKSDTIVSTYSYYKTYQLFFKKLTDVVENNYTRDILRLPVFLKNNPHYYLKNDSVFQVSSIEIIYDTNIKELFFKQYSEAVNWLSYFKKYLANNDLIDFDELPKTYIYDWIS